LVAEVPWPTVSTPTGKTPGGGFMLVMSMAWASIGVIDPSCRLFTTYHRTAKNVATSANRLKTSVIRFDRWGVGDSIGIQTSLIRRVKRHNGPRASGALGLDRRSAEGV
jgi:hypothetical protein